jgi:hypothetical protein
VELQDINIEPGSSRSRIRLGHLARREVDPCQITFNPHDNVIGRMTRPADESYSGRVGTDSNNGRTYHVVEEMAFVYQ